MLADETLACRIKDLVHHAVHVGYLVHFAVDINALRREKAEPNQVKIAIILNVVHGLIARFKERYDAVTNHLSIALRQVRLDVRFRQP